MILLIGGKTFVVDIDLLALQTEAHLFKHKKPQFAATLHQHSLNNAVGTGCACVTVDETLLIVNAFSRKIASKRGEATTDQCHHLVTRHACAWTWNLTLTRTRASLLIGPCVDGERDAYVFE